MYTVFTGYRLGSWRAPTQTSVHLFNADDPETAARWAEAYIRQCFPDASILYVVDQEVTPA